MILSTATLFNLPGFSKPLQNESICKLIPPFFLEAVFLSDGGNRLVETTLGGIGGLLGVQGMTSITKTFVPSFIHFEFIELPAFLGF